MRLTLRKKLKRRLRILRILQMKYGNLKRQFLFSVFDLQHGLEDKLQVLYERRKQIINGEYEPIEGEINCNLTNVDIPDRGDDFGKNIKGIPGFWLRVFNNIPLFWKMIHRQDVNLLLHLIDIKSVISYKEPGFALEFYFSPNNYIKDKVIKKTYVIKFGGRETDPFYFLGPVMVNIYSDKIQWTECDLTVTIKDNKIIKRASFFNFFDPPRFPEDTKLKTFILQYIKTDYELASYLKDSIIPNAVLYFLGEAVLRDSFDFDRQNKTNLDLIKNWPTYSVRRSDELDAKQTKDLEEWEQAEKLLTNILSKNIYEKSENFEEDKAKLENLGFKLGDMSDLNKKRISYLKKDKAKRELIKSQLSLTSTSLEIDEDISCESGIDREELREALKNVMKTYKEHKKSKIDSSNRN